MPKQLEAVAIEEASLLAAIAPLQAQLAEHPLYGAVRSIRGLRLFLQSHVYAVWDFMSLLKALQRTLTSVEVPWQPTVDAKSRRLINEIVLAEESDEYQGEALSHYELYLRAMESCGAETSIVRTLLLDIASGVPLDQALLAVPPEAAAFVRTTFEILATGESHRIAAAFTFGREDLIPDMFTAFIRRLDAEMPGNVAPFRYYLERHIEMDGDKHGPMALEMIRQLCTTPMQWQQAEESACAALVARIALWDGILARINGAEQAREEPIEVEPSLA